MKSVVITGASTGIGFATAEVLVKKGYQVFGSVRKQADADRLKQSLGDGVTPLLFDVTDRDAVFASVQTVSDALDGGKLSGLVNNAGIAISGPLLHIDPQEVKNQLDVNIMGVLNTTQAFGPLLGADRTRKGASGKVVNISSVAGKRSYPYMGPYSISKHGIEAFSESLRRELMPYGIDVAIIGPGAIKTPIWDKAEAIDLSVYEGTDYFESLSGFLNYMLLQGNKGLKPKAVGTLIHDIISGKKNKVRYAIVPSFFQDTLMPSLMPKRMMDRILAKRLGLTNPDD